MASGRRVGAKTQIFQLKIHLWPDEQSESPPVVEVVAQAVETTAACREGITSLLSDPPPADELGDDGAGELRKISTTLAERFRIGVGQGTVLP